MDVRCEVHTFIFLAISVFWWRIYSRIASFSYKYPSGLDSDNRNLVTTQSQLRDSLL